MFIHQFNNFYNAMRNQPSTPLRARFTKKASGCEVCVDAIVSR